MFFSSFLSRLESLHLTRAWMSQRCWRSQSRQTTRVCCGARLPLQSPSLLLPSLLLTLPRTLLLLPLRLTCLPNSQVLLLKKFLERMRLLHLSQPPCPRRILPAPSSILLLVLLTHHLHHPLLRQILSFQRLIDLS